MMSFGAAMTALDERQRLGGRAQSSRASSTIMQMTRGRRMRPTCGVFALQRCGERSGMKEAATEYLRRYPSGFRRAEVESISVTLGGRAWSAPEK